MACGTTGLVACSVQLVTDRRVQFCYLSHRDAGTGKLVRWYQSFGFQFAHDALAAQGDDVVEMFTDKAYMIVEVPVLRERIRQGSPAER